MVWVFFRAESRRLAPTILAQTTATTGTTDHFAPIARPRHSPASARCQRGLAHFTATANCHKATMQKPAMTISSIAMRLWITQLKSLASSTIPATQAKRRPFAHHSMRPKANRPTVPITADGKRHTHGASPKAQIAAAIASLPTRGCSGLAGLRRSRLRAAGT